MRLLVLVLVTGCGRIAFDPIDSDAAPGSDDPSLVAWYPMDQLAAGTPDVTAHGHDAQCDPTICPSIVDGKRGAAFRFDGVDDEMMVLSAADLLLPAGFTVARGSASRRSTAIDRARLARSSPTPCSIRGSSVSRPTAAYFSTARMAWIRAACSRSQHSRRSAGTTSH